MPDVLNFQKELRNGDFKGHRKEKGKRMRPLDSDQEEVDNVLMQKKKSRVSGERVVRRNGIPHNERSPSPEVDIDPSR